MSVVATSSHVQSEAVLDPRTRMGTVRLTVRDLTRSRAFYESVLGLRTLERPAGGLALYAAADGEPLLELHGDASARALDPQATGLFHFALLFPTRRDLAVALARVAAARWPLTGASDHLVSEALYLRDPDGHGIELYRDRPSAEWPYEHGELQMDTLRLDVEDLVTELPDGAGIERLAPAGTAIGHVHLQVSELAQTEAFYHGVVGFDVIVRRYSGALFVSAGGYHHHLGLNIWNSAGSGPPPAGSVALRSFDVVLPDANALQAVLGRVSAAGIATEERAEGTLIRDPSGNVLVLRVG
jgi:catechol 2,3-dioxygenase